MLLDAWVHLEVLSESVWFAYQHNFAVAQLQVRNKYSYYGKILAIEKFLNLAEKCITGIHG